MVWVKVRDCWVKCFVDFPPHLVITPSRQATTRQIEESTEVLVDNGVFYLIRRGLNVTYDAVASNLKRLLTKVVHTNNKAKVFILLPDNPDPLINLEWAKLNIELSENLKSIFPDLDIEPILIAHGFDLYIEYYMEIAKGKVRYIALPCRIVSFTFNRIKNLEVKPPQASVLTAVIHKLLNAGFNVHLLGLGKALIRRIESREIWCSGKVQFDSMAYRNALGKRKERKQMITSDIPHDVAFKMWWKGEVNFSPSKPNTT